jgi:cytosine/adenosine deaminase-related metal-dependent hydrolase
VASVLRARWVLPITGPPIPGGWVEIGDDDRIRAVGSGPRRRRRPRRRRLLPGLVNAHTHLELSWMAGRVPASASMNDWIRALMTLRRGGVPGGPEAEVQAAREAAQAMRAAGTVLVGDISNGLSTVGVLGEAALGGVVFHELIGFNALDPAGMVREAWAKENDVGRLFTMHVKRRPTSFSYSVVAHAPYSVSPALMTEIARRRRDAPLSIHLGECLEEIEFLRTGRGPIRVMLEELGVWSGAWPVPGCDPVEFIHRLGYLQPGLLAVHAVHLTDDALVRLRRAGATVVVGPRSNTWVGAGTPRLSHFYAAGVPVAIGTDSLASVPTLSVFDELHELRRLAPDVAAAALLDSATRQGAVALGFSHDFGSIEPGRQAALVAVQLPPDVTDVEEYLVSGVPGPAVRWAVS